MGGNVSKADQKALKGQAQQSIAQNNAQSTAINTQLQDTLVGAKGVQSSVLPGITSTYGDIAQTGGYDPSILGDIRTTYGDFAKTGGISDVDATAMRNRSAEAAKGAYDVGINQAQRAATATGGYGDVSGAIVGDLARKGSQAAATSVTAANADIAKLRQTGKLEGAEGLQRTEQGLTGNKLAAAGGLTNVYGLSTSEVNSTVDSILRNFQANGQLNAQEQQILAQLATQPGIFDKIMSTIGTLGGAAAGILSGVGAISHGGGTVSSGPQPGMSGNR